MKYKICKGCKKLITAETAVIQSGYLATLCKPCKRKEAREYAAKRKKLHKGGWFESN